MRLHSPSNIPVSRAPTLLGIAGLALCSAHAAHPVGGADTRGETVHACWPIDESGALTGTTVEMQMSAAVLDFRAQGLRENAGDNRVDLVFVGDGYTAGELGVYTNDVNNVVATFFTDEPFISYEPYFRVSKVDVVSPQSGVDNDPTQGISRTTALDMGYWCNNIERLLCVNTGKAYTAAFNAGVPDVDQIIALANSSKYGGAGYSGSDLATAAGHNSLAVQIAIHEIGHSLGDLADEYDYGGPTVYAGGEPFAANSSIYDATTQATQERKWFRWLGAGSDPRFDGTVGTYEGSSYSVLGIYRPSNNSIMRSLSRPFNQPSGEALIANIYKEVSPIDDAADNASPLVLGDSAWVVPMRPIGHDLLLEWTVDGFPRPELDGSETVVVDSLGLAPGPHLITVTVTDPTDMVRDESLRTSLMSATRTWQVQAGCQNPADLNADGVIDNGDIGVFLGLFLGGDLSADLNGDGFLDQGDIGAFVEAFLGGC